MEAMAKYSLSSLSIIFSLLSIVTAVVSAPPKTLTFIEASCKANKYPEICIKTLMPHESDIDDNLLTLTRTALIQTRRKTIQTGLFMARMTKFLGLMPAELAVLEECRVLMAKSVGKVTGSLAELDKLVTSEEEKFLLHQEKTKAWLHTTISYGNSCRAGLHGSGVSAQVKGKVGGWVADVRELATDGWVFVSFLRRTRL